MYMYDTDMYMHELCMYMYEGLLCVQIVAMYSKYGWESLSISFPLVATAKTTIVDSKHLTCQEM